MVENTHEPIIDKECFDIVRRRAESRTIEHSKGFVNIFSGIAKCADCGKNMSTVGTRKKYSPANLACGGYKLNGTSECSNHFIDYNVFYDIVLNAVREQIRLSDDEKRLLALELKQKEERQDDKAVKAEFAALAKRNEQLDSMIEKLYEDNFAGRLSNDRFQKILAKYEKEGKAITDTISVLNESLSARADQSAKESYKQFVELIREFTEVETLTPDLLFKLIDRIEVGQGHYKTVGSRKVKSQEITMCFRFIGKTETQKIVS